MSRSQSWPEPVVRVQSLSESGISSIPKRYVKPKPHRPMLKNACADDETEVNIPFIDLQDVFSQNEGLRKEMSARVYGACRECGFFQLVNHGVSHELMQNMREVWREFFNLPLEVKQEYANTPVTYEGYGSRLGVEKEALLDWSDYFFLNLLPVSLRDESKWPEIPSTCREIVAEYGREVVKLGGKLMKALSVNLGLKEDYLLNAFGGENNVGACLRVNFYPKCPQPDLTLGLSPHSDPGGLTILLPDENVAGLQVRRGETWVTIKPSANAFIVNIGDQIKVLSNGIYQSVEHRVIVNSDKDRVSLALFYNPKSDLAIAPSGDLVTDERPALCAPMTFDEYRMHVRTKGVSQKQNVESSQHSC